MKVFSSIIIIWTVLLLPAVHAQQQTARTTLALYGGTGSLAVRDEFISLRRYSGPFTTFGAEWGTVQDSARNSFSVEYQHGGSINNNHSEADVSHIRMYIDHQTFVRKISIFGFDGEWYLGPAGIMAMHIRTQHVAQKEMLSDFMSLYQENSIALSTSFNIPLIGSWMFQGDAVIDAVTIGLRLVDDSKPLKDRTVKVLFPWTNLNGRLRLGIEYQLSSDLVVSGSYLFQYVGNTAWDDLFIAGDNVLVRASYVW